MHIARYALRSPAVLAPMAGVTDRPFRELCRHFGAALAPAEMLHADQRLWRTEKSRRRMDHEGESEPRVVQLAGADPGQLAEAAANSNRVKASYAVKHGDTLASIARLYQTTVASMKSWNPRLPSGGQLAAGQHLTVYRLAN